MDVIQIGCAVASVPLGFWAGFKFVRLYRTIHKQRVQGHAFNRVIMEYGLTVAERLSEEQIMALAKYKGPKPPVVATDEDVARNRFAPNSPEEAQEIVNNIILREQLQRMQDDPAAREGRIAVPPKFADGREVSYFSRKRKPLALPPAYFETLARNQEAIAAVERAARPDARPAIEWTKPDHMELTPDPHGYENEAIAGPNPLYMLEGPNGRICQAGEGGQCWWSECPINGNHLVDCPLIQYDIRTDV